MSHVGRHPLLHPGCWHCPLVQGQKTHGTSAWEGSGEKACCRHSTCPLDRGFQSQCRQASILQQSSMLCNTRTSPQTSLYPQEASAPRCGLTKALMFQFTDPLFIFLKRAWGNSSPERDHAGLTGGRKRDLPKSTEPFSAGRY